jgi:hypothetical protein
LSNAAFVAAMEDVLDVYHLPYNIFCPVICMDEKPYQLLGERREPIPMKPKSKKKVDNEYERMGTCSIFVMTEPLTGWVYTRARKQRTAEDWAYEIRDLLTYIMVLIAVKCPACGGTDVSKKWEEQE